MLLISFIFHSIHEFFESDIWIVLPFQSIIFLLILRFLDTITLDL